MLNWPSSAFIGIDQRRRRPKTNIVHFPNKACERRTCLGIFAAGIFQQLAIVGEEFFGEIRSSDRWRKSIAFQMNTKNSDFRCGSHIYLP